VSPSIVLRAEAVAEFDEAFDFYGAQRIGLGPEFAAEVQRALDRIVRNPELHPCVAADVRKSAVRRFPYCIFYRAHVDRVEVIAIFHTSRDPAEWQGRI
jgi:plasmid stabilization system protein ParE